MKRIAACLCLITAFGMAPAYAADIDSIAWQIEQINEQVRSRIEKLEFAREKADARLTLAAARLEEQMRIAEEELERRMEQLRTFRDQLGFQVEGTGASMEDLQRNWNRQMQEVFDTIRRRLSETDALMARMRDLRSKIGTLRTSLGGADPLDSPTDAMFGIGDGPTNKPMSQDTPVSPSGIDSSGLSELERLMQERQNNQPSSSSPQSSSCCSGNCPQR